MSLKEVKPEMLYPKYMKGAGLNPSRQLMPICDIKSQSSCPISNRNRLILLSSISRTSRSLIHKLQSMMLTVKPFVPITIKPRFLYNTRHHRHHHINFCKSPLKLRTKAQNDGGNDSAKESSNGVNKPISDDDGNDSKKDQFAGFSFKWGDLLNPDQDNFVAVALAGVLTWASLQVLSQLFFISFAILVAALKYSFIAALLIFILVTLL